MTTHIRPYNTIRATLVRPKDKLSIEEQCGAVYQIICTNCPATYVDETERPLAKRLKKHQRPGSTVSDHIVEHNHSFTKEDVVVKHQEKDWFHQGVAESIHIAEERPPLNHDQACHTLLPIYRQLLSSRDPSDPYDNRESRDDDAETSVF